MKNAGLNSLQDLYTELWRLYIIEVGDGIPSAKERKEAIYCLVDYMHRKKSLRVPEEILEDYDSASIYLQKEGILYKTDNNYQFFHDTFFDYCCARKFVRKGISITEEVLSGEQNLFVRSLVTQVLNYLRARDFSQYLSELSNLLYEDNLRIHIKWLILEWLGSLPEPTFKELKLIKDILNDKKWRYVFLEKAMKNMKWFEMLSEKELPIMLETEKYEEISKIIWCWRFSIKHSPLIVINFLKLYIKKLKKWDEIILCYLTYLENWEVRDAQFLLKEIININIENYNIQICLENIANTDPFLACDMIGQFLNKKLEIFFQKKFEKENLSNKELSCIYKNLKFYCYTLYPVDLIRDIALKLYYSALSSDLHNTVIKYKQEIFSDIICDISKEVSEKVPECFLEKFLPWFERYSICLESSKVQKDFYYSDYFFCNGWNEEFRYSSSIFFAKYMANSFTYIAKNQKKYFKSLIKELSKSEWMLFHRFIIKGFLVDPKLYFEDIYEYIIEDKRRLQVGDNNYDSYELIEAVYPYLNESQRNFIENLILNYTNTLEKKTPRFRGRGALGMASFIPEEYLSKKGRLKFLELKRKFPKYKKPSRNLVHGGFVGPPISGKALPYMDDEAWLNAMYKYNDSYTQNYSNIQKGDVAQQSIALRQEVKKDPERFYNLAKRFDERISFYYIWAIFVGLNEAEGAEDYIYDLAKIFYRHENKEVRLEICRNIIEKISIEIPDDIINIVRYYALNDNDPDIKEEKYENSENDYYRNLYQVGRNTVRGNALYTYCRYLLQKENPEIDKIFDFLEIVKQDPSTVVRACIIRVLTYMTEYGLTRCINIFEDIIKEHYKLLQCHSTHDFLYNTRKEYFRINSYLEYLLETKDEYSEEAGARLICLAFLDNPHAKKLVNKALSGNKSMRKGAVQVFARNLEHKDIMEKCKFYLTEYLLNDSEPEVLKEIGDCFKYLKIEQLDDIKDFIYDFINSPALLENYAYLVEYIEKLVDREPEFTLDIVEKIIEQNAKPSYVQKNRDYRNETKLVNIIFRIHDHISERNGKIKILDLLDRLLELEKYSVREVLNRRDRQ